MNTGETDLDIVGERTQYVFGRSVAAGGAGSPGPPTATGVSPRHPREPRRTSTARTSLAGRTVRRAGSGQRRRAAGRAASRPQERQSSSPTSNAGLAQDRRRPGRRVGARPQTPRSGQRLRRLLAPCAVGGTLSAETVPLLRCRVVAGSANNQLADPAAADLLHERGILYAPDYVINAGGAVGVVGARAARMGQRGGSSRRVWHRIGETLQAIYERADERGVPTATAADALADERIAAG